MLSSHLPSGINPFAANNNNNNNNNNNSYTYAFQAASSLKFP